MLVSRISLSNNYQNKQQTNFNGKAHQKFLNRILNPSNLGKTLRESFGCESSRPLVDLFTRAYNGLIEELGKTYEFERDLYLNGVQYGKIFKSKTSGARICLILNDRLTNPAFHYIQRTPRTNRKIDDRLSIIYYLTSWKGIIKEYSEGIARRQYDVPHSSDKIIGFKYNTILKEHDQNFIDITQNDIGLDTFHNFPLIF